MKFCIIYKFLFILTWLCFSLQNTTAKVRLLQIKGSVISVDSIYDVHPDLSMQQSIKNYKLKMDSMMNVPIGIASCTMEGGRPESLLSNLTAELLRWKAARVLGKPADVGIINVGGLRAPLSEGKITIGSIYEIFPFENTLVVVRMKGSLLKQLFEQMAYFGGEGLSGAQLNITDKGQLVSCTVQGEPIDMDKEYTIGTIDFVAGGNDGMLAFRQSYGQQNVPDGLLRDVFINYVKDLQGKGEMVTSKLDGRIKIVQP